MTIHGSSRGRGHIRLILLAVLGTALVSLLALPQWDSSARADGQQKGRGQQITLKRSAAPAVQHKLIEAANQGNVEPYIVGGTPVPDDKYPFMAYLEATFKDGAIQQCGGTLIDPDSVLTAAHCLVSPQGAVPQVVNVGVGGTALSQREYQLRTAATAFIASTYNPTNQSNDAAVLNLDSAVTGIKPIKLATAKQNRLERPGRLLTVAGWGRTDPNDATSTVDRMLEVSLPVVSDATAKQAWSTPTQVYVPSLMVATDSQAGKDAAQGDSGGPLFNPGATPTQVGIVSYGSKGPRTRGALPTAYTEVNNSGIRTFIVNSAKR
jgi:secreted trypsin-like serine protease